MARGPKKHLKRLDAPKTWMLDKMGGIFATRPRTGPHKMRESLPIILMLRNRLKYALNGRECITICQNKHVKVDGKVRTDHRFPCGVMDVIELEKAKEAFRLLYDTKGRFVMHRIPDEEKKFKLGKVTGTHVGAKKVPSIVTHDGRTIRYPDPIIKKNDTVKIDLETGKVVGILKFDIGNTLLITKGRNRGRIGVLLQRDRHLGGFDIIHVRDAAGNTFATRLSSGFVIGQGNNSEISLPKGKGVKISILEEKALRSAKKK